MPLSLIKMQQETTAVDPDFHSIFWSKIKRCQRPSRFWTCMLLAAVEVDFCMERQARRKVRTVFRHNLTKCVHFWRVWRPSARDSSSVKLIFRGCPKTASFEGCLWTSLFKNRVSTHSLQNCSNRIKCGIPVRSKMQSLKTETLVSKRVF